MTNPLLSSRVADLVHLLEHATITTPSVGDAELAQRILASLREHYRSITSVTIKAPPHGFCGACDGSGEVPYKVYEGPEVVDDGMRNCDACNGTGEGAAPAPEWVSVDDRMPPDRQFVLVKCPSGYTTTPFVYTTARHDEAYRPGRWIDHANDGLGDWGMEPTHWRALP